MQYMLVFNENHAQFDDRVDPGKAGAYWGAWSDYIAALNRAGVMVSGNGLQAPHTGTRVQVRDGRRHVQDGPFADSKEQLAGYVVIEVADLDGALDWAAKAPCAATASVEVRPVLPPMAASEEGAPPAATAA